VREASFTLLELVLVVAIIAILIAMSFPAYLSAREQAQRVACRVATRSYAMKYSKTGRLVIEIPQEANCHECHRPRYNARQHLNTVE